MKININYVTTNTQKVRENAILQGLAFDDGKKISDLFNFNVWGEHVVETLEVDLQKLVTAEVAKAYERLKIPCVVEHAGLVLVEHAGAGYPGGLTKAMWNALETTFVRELGGANRPVIARAVVAYCDGATVKTFTGETPGHLAAEPRGTWDFYWDRVFVPDIPAPAGDQAESDLTYSELVDRHGLEFKVASLSQSTKAVRLLLNYLRKEKTSFLWA